MYSLTANPVASPGALPLVSTAGQLRSQTKHIGKFPLKFRPFHISLPQTQSLKFGPLRSSQLRLQSHVIKGRQSIISQARKANPSAVICAAALNATCASEQTQTVTRQSSTITIAPTQGKEKSPELDDGGSGLPPRDDGDGGGGGGGGGGWSGGFFFFGFLLFLGFLRDQENESPYKD